MHQTLKSTGNFRKKVHIEQEFRR